jgi:hypothetical protein
VTVTFAVAEYLNGFSTQKSLEMEKYFYQELIKKA